MNVRWIKVTSSGKEEWSFSHRLFSATEMTSLMRDAGFQDVKAYGGLDGTPYDNTARKLVIVAKKE